MATKKNVTSKNVVSIKDDIPAQIETLRGDVAKLTETLKKQAKAKMSDKASTVKDVTDEKTQELKQRYDELAKSTEASIKENPLSAIAIAIGAGVVLGALTRR